MINFSDAQMLGANDKAFQNQYNYLVELVSTYLTRGMLQSVNENTYIDLGKNRFQFMKDANNYIKWDGETFEVKGKITVTSGTATRTFVAEPTTPYKIGDIWMQGGTGDILVCITSRETGVYNSDDWEVSSKYTDDTLAATKTKTFYQPSIPTSTAIGDLWVDTGDDNVLYRAESVGADEIAAGKWVKMPFGVGALGDTVIDGGYIKTNLLTADNIITGKLQDSSGSTYFDLDNAEIVATDGNNKLVLDETGLHGYVSDVLRVEVEYDRLEFHRAGSSVGNIRSEYISDAWRGSVLGDCLFVEAAGNSIAFNAASGSTAPSLVVAPTWAEIPNFITETIGIGVSDTPPWYMETQNTDADFVIGGTYGDHLSINDYTGQITIGAGLNANDVYAKYFESELSTGVAMSSINATADSSNAWNSNTKYGLKIDNSNNALTIIVGGTTNDRNAMIQVGHSTNSYANVLGDLWLNPLGGDVNIEDDLNINGNIVGGTSNDGTWITCRRIGCGVAASESYSVDASTTGYMRAGRYYANTGYYVWNTYASSYSAGWSGVYGGAMYIGGLLINPTP